MSRRNRAVLTVLVAIALLGGLYWVIEKQLAGQEAPAEVADDFRLEIPLLDPNAPPHAPEGFPTFKAMQGETLTLTIHSERPGSVHVHGYERYVDLVPHADVTLTFEAKDAGLFPVHLHDADNVMEHLAVFEILPK